MLNKLTNDSKDQHKYFLQHKTDLINQRYTCLAVENVKHF